MAKTYDIFISYRRLDNEGRTGGRDIARTLKLEFEKRKYKVFFDYSEIKDEEFESKIIPAIRKSKFFILILSKDALYRCKNENDWVRREINEAINANCKIIPINPDGQFTKWPDFLPADIEKIKGVQISDLSLGSLFEKSVDKIIEDRMHKKHYKTTLILCILIGLIITFFCFINNSRQPISVPAETKIEPIKRDITFLAPKGDTDFFSQKLIARIDGYEYNVDLGGERCIVIEDQRDFDGDGIDDVLVCDIQACGGNGMPNAWFFVKYIGEGFFSVTDVFGNSYGDPVIEKWNDTWSVIVESTNEGFNREKNFYTRERYILKDGKAEKVESSKKSSITSVLKELRASDFHDGHEYDTLEIVYDLDNNGVDDKIICNYWDRWDSMFISFEINGNPIEFHDGYDRIAIIQSKTNGFYNLIGGEDTLIKWNGKEYVSQ